MNTLNLTLHDNEFPNNGYTHKRQVARAFVINDDNKIAILHIKGDDIFGHRDYYETSGGGVDEGEKKEEAVLRELDEEIGYKCEIVSYLGCVSDEYNLIKRQNENHFFLCKTISKTHIHHVSEGDSLIDKICWVDNDELLHLYESMTDTLIARLVAQREYPFAKLVCEILK
jgi:hydrolase, NUDIX family